MKDLGYFIAITIVYLLGILPAASQIQLLALALSRGPCDKGPRDKAMLAHFHKMKSL